MKFVKTFALIFLFFLFTLCGKKKASCNDGLLNQNEIRTDCGGVCPPCATCSDGLLNQDETAVDCGGICDKCPTCSDGIQNQNETDIDCGGLCNKCTILYPVAGKSGSSVIQADNISIQAGVLNQSTTFYSLRAELPLGTKLKVVFKNTTGPSNALWYYTLASVEGWNITTYDNVSKTQIFYASGKKSCDLQLVFTGVGSAYIEIFENDSPTPLRTKSITWQ